MNENTDLVLSEPVEDLLKKIAIETGFVEYNLSVSPGSNHCDGFIGIIIRVTIKGMRNNVLDELSLIVKQAPQNETRREQFQPARVFNREIYAYNEVLPEIEKFQKEKGLTSDTGFSGFPKCYGTIADSSTYTYCLVLEDLKASGFQMWNKFNTIELDQVELVIKEQAKLHAVSFALRDQKPEIFEKFLHLKDTLLPLMKREEIMLIMNTSFDKAIETLDSSIDQELITKMTELQKNYISEYEFCVTRQNSEPFAVIGHGDSWTNNMMFSYQQTDHKLDKVRFIDWQLCRVASPVLDLLYFLSTSTHKELRDLHYKNILKTYYITLADSINKLGSDPNKLFPLVNFQEQLKKFGKFALIMSVMVVQVVEIDPKDVPSLDEVTKNMSNKDPNSWDFVQANSDRFIKRMSDVIREFMQ